ncbi:MAG: hypothetical protein R2714_11145 [Microthrixaceae bacterium]
MATRKKKTPAGPTPVEATEHSDKRTNIPTGELAGFVADQEKEPGSVLYPRDPTLDPQLVWMGKDEQDLAEYLNVASVPVYIQEKIDPRALIENLRDTAKDDEPEPELTLFDDFDGLEFDEIVDFYAHEGNWSNRMILGDSLMVMNSLAEKEQLRGKVQMVFIDPPYGIRFGSNWQVSTRKRRPGQPCRRHSTAGASQGIPGYVGAGYPLLPELLAGPADSGTRDAHRVGIMLHADR